MNQPRPRRTQPGPHEPVYVISVAADLVGVHPQTLRGYEKAGLVTPARTRGGVRRYSANDIDKLRHIQALTDEGLPLSGVARVLELERRLADTIGPSTALVRRDPHPTNRQTDPRRPTRRRSTPTRPHQEHAQ